jgi:HEAT repeat protein
MSGDRDQLQPKPKLRHLEVVDEDGVEQAIASGDARRIHYALIDGSRCLDDAFICPLAVQLLVHEDVGVRWAAAFAINQCRLYFIQLLRADGEPLHTLAAMARDDPDAEVRGMAAEAMKSVVFALLRP